MAATTTADWARGRGVSDEEGRWIPRVECGNGVGCSCVLSINSGVPVVFMTDRTLTATLLTDGQCSEMYVAHSETTMFPGPAAIHNLG